MNTAPIEIRIVSVDKNKISRAPNSTFYSYPFRLSEHPDKEWLTIFKNMLGQRVADGAMLDIQVMGDTIYVKMSAEENVQSQLDLQKEFVEQVNKEYNQARLKKAQEQEILDNQKQAADDELRKLRDETDNLKF